MKIKAIALGIVAILIIAGGLIAVQAGNDDPGNGAPSGKHYTLNILGKDWGSGEEIPEDPTWTNDNGHRIFVRLNGKTRIMLHKAPIEDEKFAVLDHDGTDGRAEFQLPKPYAEDPAEGENVNSDDARYRVFIRVLSPRGNADMYTTVYDGSMWIEAAEIDWIKLEGKNGQKTFDDVTRQLTTIYIDITDDGKDNPVRYGLFDSRLDGFLWAWDYDNEGLRHAQIRFYPVDPALQ